MSAASGESQELRRVKTQLAEMVDEVVFSEQEKERAELERNHLAERLELLEGCLQNFIAYCSSIEALVLLPALKELSAAIPDESLSRRAQAIHQLDALQNLSAKTSKLILSLKNPSASVLHKLQRRRDEILRGHQQADEQPLNLEEAYLLVAFLLEAKDELRVLINDTVQRVQRDRMGSSRSFAAASESTGRLRGVETERSLQESLNAANAECGRLRETLSAVQSDREALLAKLNQMAPFRELQEQYHAERDSLHQRLKTAESDVRRLSDESLNATQALEATRKALDQAFREKSLLEDELSQMRRGTGPQGSTMTSFGQSISSPPGVRSSWSAIGSTIGGFGASGGQKYWEDHAHRLELELDSATRKHASVVAKLEGQVSQLRLELSEAKTESVNGSSVMREQLSQLRHANEAMQRELVVLQQQFLSSPSAAGASRSLGTHHGGSVSPEFSGKIRAFEETIQSLHVELATVDGKVAAVERHYAAERAMLLKEFDEERLRYQQEREECDLLVLRMSAEMEQLVKENDALRAVTQVR